MRRRLLLPAIMLVAAGAYALTPPEQEKTSDETAPEVESDSGEGARNKPPAAATTFTPTEKIEADSAVSFPVDI